MSRHRRPQGFNRTDRIADQIQRELSRLLQFEMKDPRVNLATIQDVTVSRDLSFAAEAVLVKASGFLRSSLAQSLNTRTTPKLRFHYDMTPERAAHLSQLIDEARAEDRELRPDNDETEND